jgi:hypothetical protein
MQGDHRIGVLLHGIHPDAALRLVRCGETGAHKRAPAGPDHHDHLKHTTGQVSILGQACLLTVDAHPFVQPVPVGSRTLPKGCHRQRLSKRKA